MPVQRNRLKELRLKYGYTQEYVADSIGMTQSGYSRVERGETALCDDVICALASLYDVTADYILER